MVTLKINNVPVTVEEGTTILNAAAKPFPPCVFSKT